MSRKFYFMLGLSDKGQKPHTASSKRVGGRWGQRAGLSEAREVRGKAATSLNKKGKVDAGESSLLQNIRKILVALASLIRAQRYEMALTILENELWDDDDITR